MCGPLDLGDCASQVVGSAVGDAITKLADAVLEMFGSAVSSLGTVWVSIGTPDLSSTGGSSQIDASAPPGSSNVVTALAYATWIALALAAVAAIWLGMLMAASLRRGEGALHVGRLGLVLGGVVMISAAGSLVSGLVPSGPWSGAGAAGGATLFLQSGLWWYTTALAVLSVIVAGFRMVWENRAEPGKDLVKSLLTLIVVAGSAVTFTQLFIAASDSFSVWLLRGSLNCDVTSNSACFGKNVATLLSLSATGGAPALASMVVIVLGLVASLASFVQILLMVARSGMLVILAGILPLTAAAGNTDMGRAWFRRCIGWLIAFLLYKPAAAIVYATAFQLVGTSLFKSKDSVVAILTGLMLMLLAVAALPALMRFVTPLVSSLASGSGGAALGGAAAAVSLPTGAAQAGRLVGGGPIGGGGPSGGRSTAPTSGATPPTGATSSGGGSGAGGASGTAGGSAPRPQAPGGGAGPVGSAAGGTQAAAQGARGGTAGSAAGLNAGGAASGGLAAAGAAAGPVGLAAGATASGAAKVAGAAQSAASAAADKAAGNGSQGT